MRGVQLITNCYLCTQQTTNDRHVDTIGLQSAVSCNAEPLELSLQSEGEARSWCRVRLCLLQSRSAIEIFD